MALVLCLTMLPACTACGKKKKTTQKREVAETDPYFDAQTQKLSLPIDESKELINNVIESVEYIGDGILVKYSISYQIPNDAYTQEDFSYDDYYKNGTALFDLTGNLVDSDLLKQSDYGEVQCVTTDKEGNLVLLFVMWDFEDPGKNELRIRFQNDAGETVKEVTPEIPKNMDLYSINTISILPDGKIVLQSFIGAAAPIYVFDENGKSLFAVTPMDRAICSGIFSENGKYYVLTAAQDYYLKEEADFQINEIDMTNGALKSGEKAKGILSPQSISTGDDGLYSTTPNGIMKYNISSGEMEEVLNWNQTDVDHGLLLSVQSYPKNENEIHAIAVDYGSGITDAAYYHIALHRAEKNPHAGKKVMYVGGRGIDGNFYDFINRYNADPENELRIETIDYLYSEEETGYGDGFSASVENTVYLALLSGDAPDLLLNFAGCDQFAAAGVLEDLNPYIDGKNGLDRSLYFDNIFRSMENDGKLYYAPLDFVLCGFMVNPEMIKADREWTFDDLDSAYASLPEGTRLLPKMKCEKLLGDFIGPDFSDYMDYEKKEVHFATPEMERVLEETKKYGCSEENASEARWISTTPGDAGYEGLRGLGKSEMDGLESIGLLLYAGSVAMSSVTVEGFNDYHMIKNTIPGGGKLLGYPSFSGKGVVALPSSSLAIVASSGYKDEAWEIIRSFYSDEAQNALGDSGFPLSRAAFEKTGEECSEKIGRVYDYYRKNEGYYDCVYFPMDPNMVDEVREIIEGIKYSMHRDAAVLQIVEEETAGYFYDARPAQEVLKTVDNRARQIVAER